MEQAAFLEELLQIQQNSYAVPDDMDAYPYAQIIMEEIGGEQSELIYDVLTRWIADDVFGPKKLRGLLLIAMSPDFLLYAMEENQTNGVLRRALSAGLVAEIVRAHERNAFLSHSQLESVAEQMIEYMYVEHDLRTYIEGMGAVEAMKHASAACTAIARCLTAEQDSFVYMMLEAIKEKIWRADAVYGDGEEEPFVQAVYTIWNTGFINEMYMAAWIVSLLERDEVSQPEEEIMRRNTELFLQSLYSQLAKENENLVAVLEETMEQLKQ